MSSNLSSQPEDAVTVSSSLEARLAGHPELKAKIESLLCVVENAQGELSNAHEAEQQVIEEIQKLGQLALQGWAELENERQSRELMGGESGVHRSRKKPCIGTADTDG